MNATRISPVLAALVLAAPVELLAQDQEPVPVGPGDRIRVTALDVSSGRIVGTLMAFSGDTLILGAENRGHVSLPLGSVSTLEVSRGRKSRALAGAGIGALAGLASFGVLARPCPDCNEPDNVGTLVVATFVILTGGGALIGALVGSAIRVERWEPVALEGLRVSFTSRRDDELAVRVSHAL